jgi:putative peptidoglycan lipid II flippase
LLKKTEDSDGRDGAAKKAFMSSTYLLAFGTLVSRSLGLIRDMMTARYFPPELRDAFLVAFRLPNIFRRVFGEGSLGVSFIPVFLEILAGHKSVGDEAELRARQMATGVLAILLIITGTLSLLGIIYMEQLLSLLLSGQSYLSIPGKFELTVRLARIVFGFLVLISVYAFFMAVLNGLKKFTMVAFAPCLFNVALISAAFFSSRFIAPIETLAWAVIVGGLLQLAFLVPSVARAGYLQWPQLPKLKNDTYDIFRVLGRFFPGLLGMSAMHLSALVSLHFASYLPQGAHSYLYFADRILEFPLSLVAVSVGSVLLPSLSSLWAEGDHDGMSVTMTESIRMVLFVAVPATLGMFALAHPIAETLFLGREFKYQDAVATAQIIQIYSFGLILWAGVRILAQGFFAIGNTWFPAVAAGVSLISHILIAGSLMGAFGLPGLAMASIGAAAINLIMLSAGYHTWVGVLRLKHLGFNFLKFSSSGLVMVVSLQAYPTLHRSIGGGTLFNAIALMLMIAIAAAVYFMTVQLAAAINRKTQGLLGIKAKEPSQLRYRK